MIAVIDYGMGNLRSVAKAFETVGAEVFISSEPKDIHKADSVVLPGVGAFKDCMENLQEKKLDRAVRDFINSGKPFLGICHEVLVARLRRARMPVSTRGPEMRRRW